MTGNRPDESGVDRETDRIDPRKTCPLKGLGEMAGNDNG
jgi:hypothetical protein